MRDPGLCFRGTEDQSYRLNPSLLRWPYPESPTELARIENSLWIEFRLRSKPLLGHHVVNAWEALLTQQQYGLPTRLLDWSRSLAVAAYFAVRDNDESCDGAIWIMAAKHLFELRGANDACRTAVGDPALEPLGIRENAEGLAEFNAQTPVALSPDQFVPRMVVQQGLYTLHTFQKDVLESLAISDRVKSGNSCFLHKVIIPAKAKAGIKSELSVLAGIREDVLFPDIEGFARSFVSEHKYISKRRAL